MAVWSEKSPARTHIAENGLRLLSNSTLKMKRCQLLTVMKHEGSFYMCISLSQKCKPSPKILNISQLFLTDPNISGIFSKLSENRKMMS